MTNDSNSRSIKILLVEDSPTDARLLLQELKDVRGGNFEVTVVERLGDAVARLDTQSFDVGLLDLSLPDSTGMATFIRFQEAAPALPVVVLTGATDEAMGIEAIRHGVQDYLVKGTADGTAVARAIRYAVERKGVEDALRESELRLRAVAETTPVGISVVDLRTGEFLYANQAYETSFGYDRMEIIGSATSEIYADAGDRTRILSLLEEQGHVTEYEVRFRRKDGSQFWGLCSIRPITFDARPALLGAFVDISNRKQTEDALRQKTEELRATNEELSFFNRAMVDRELRMVELKKQVNELCVRLGQAPEYDVDAGEAKK